MSDLIDKQALLEEIENGIRAGNLEEGYRRYQTINNMDDIIETIRYADVVQPERKWGLWIQFPNHDAYKCSECGRVIETTDGKNNVCKHYPYCHCGCKMEVEHEFDEMGSRTKRI